MPYEKRTRYEDLPQAFQVIKEMGLGAEKRESGYKESDPEGAEDTDKGVLAA